MVYTNVKTSVEKHRNYSAPSLDISAVLKETLGLPDASTVR